MLRDQVGNHQAAARTQAPVQPGEHGQPLLVPAQMMQRGSRQHDIVPAFAQIGLADIPLHRRDPAGRTGRNAFDGPVEHRAAQVEQRAMKPRPFRKHFERIVSRPAAHV